MEIWLISTDSVKKKLTHYLLFKNGLLLPHILFTDIDQEFHCRYRYLQHILDFFLQKQT